MWLVVIMFYYNIEYRENILFIRLIGDLNKKNINSLDEEIKNIIYNLGIYNIVFNFAELNKIDMYSSNLIIDWYNLIKQRKGVSLVCGMHNKMRKNTLLSNLNEINNELCAIRVINWNN